MELPDSLVAAAISLGKQKMVLEVIQRYGFVGAREEEAKAREEYNRRLQVFAQEVEKCLTAVRSV